jgi:hypothetical protein
MINLKKKTVNQFSNQLAIFELVLQPYLGVSHKLLRYSLYGMSKHVKWLGATMKDNSKDGYKRHNYF